MAQALASSMAAGELDEAMVAAIDGDLGDAQIERLLEDAQALLREAIRSNPHAGQALYRTYMATSELRDEVAARLSHRRLEALTAIRAALTRLRGISSLAQMMDRATLEVCRSCGFDRAMIWRIDGSELIAESVCIPSDPSFAERVRALAREQPPKLGHLMIETEMLRQGSGALILDAAGNPGVYKPFVELVGSTSYVAAPIMPQGRVIGFLHADLQDSGRVPDELDQEVLGTFAEGFGYAVERTILLERLSAQREQVERLVSSTQSALSALWVPEVELVAVDAAVDAAPMPAVAPQSLTFSSEFGRILTRRELDVMQLMITGATNSRIADQLVISEGTAKCHVGSILRKLHCANRGEAIARYSASFTSPAA